MNTMMNLPTLLAAGDMTFSDRASEAFVMVIMGMAMVFLVLTLIMLILMVMERIFAAKSVSGGEVKAPAPKKAPAPTPTPVVQQPASDDGAVVAAITAAISAMLAESGDTTYQNGFRVVSFRRSGRNNPWNSAK